MLRRCVVLGGTTFLMMACLAFGQERGGPGRGGFGGGFGGPGGPGGGPASYATLLGMPEVVKEIGLDGGRKSQVEAVLRAQQEASRAAFGSVNFQELQDLSPEERQNRLAEMRKKIEQANQQAEDKLAKLLDAKQRARLDQLRLQRDGLAALVRPEVAKQLGLSDQQVAAIKKLQEQSRGGFAGSGGPNQSEEQRRPAMARLQQQREKNQADILAVLTEAQRAKWAEMKGKAFTFPAPRGFGGMGMGSGMGGGMGMGGMGMGGMGMGGMGMGGMGMGGMGRNGERVRPPAKPGPADSGKTESPEPAVGVWSRFRGSDGSAVSSLGGLPKTWSDTAGVVWKTPLPGAGSSSAIVAGDRVYVTCYSGYGANRENPGKQEDLLRHVVCVNLADGKILWQKEVRPVLPEDAYQGMIMDHGYASSTPAADDQRVYVFFGKSGVLAFDRDGKQLWQTSVGTGSAMMGWGSAASVVLYKDLVIVNANAESQSLVALDKKTGAIVWKAEAKGYTGSWSTPVLVATPEGKQELAIHMPEEVWGLNPANGGLVWYCTQVRGAATSSVVAKDGIVYAVGGGPMGSGSTAIRAGGRNDVTKGSVLWSKPAGSYVPSPAVVGGHLYWVDDRGVAYCVKADTGEEVYRQRINGAANVYASVVAADGKLYAVSRRNGTFVLAAAPEFKVLAQNRFESDDTDFNASPAVTEGRLLLRSNRALYCLGTK